MENERLWAENVTLEKARAEAEAVSGRYKVELERLLEAARKLAEENMALKKTPGPVVEDTSERDDAVEQMWMMRARYKAAGCRLQYAVFLRWAEGSFRGYIHIWKTRTLAAKMSTLFKDKSDFMRSYNNHAGRRRQAALLLFDSLLTQNSRVGKAVAFSTWVYVTKNNEGEGPAALLKRINELEQLCASKDIRGGASLYGVGRGQKATLTVEYRDENGTRCSTTRNEVLTVRQTKSDGVSSPVYLNEPDLTYNLTFRTAPDVEDVIVQLEVENRTPEAKERINKYTGQPVQGKLMTMRNSAPPRGPTYTGEGSYSHRTHSGRSTSPRGKSPSRFRSSIDPRSILDVSGDLRKKQHGMSFEIGM